MSSELKPCPSCHRPLVEIHPDVLVCERDHVWEGTWPMCRVYGLGAAIAIHLRDESDLAEPSRPPEVERLLAAAKYYQSCADDGLLDGDERKHAAAIHAVERLASGDNCLAEPPRPPEVERLVAAARKLNEEYIQYGDVGFEKFGALQHALAPFERPATGDNCLAEPPRPPEVERLVAAARMALGYMHVGRDLDVRHELEHALAPFERPATGDSGKSSLGD